MTPLRQRILEDTAIRNLAENMIAAVESYPAQCRSAGYALSNVEYLLRSFATFAADHQEQHIRTATVVRWAGQTASVAQRHARYQAVQVIFLRCRRWLRQSRILAILGEVTHTEPNAREAGCSECN